MTRIAYCMNCGSKLGLHRKALPRYGVIVTLVESHTCLDEPIDFDLEPLPEMPTGDKEEHEKFVQKLNDLNKPKQGVVFEPLKDRRFEEKEGVKSTAPSSVLGIIQDIENSVPARPLNDPESED